MHPIIGQLSNDANMAGVGTMCSGYDTSELSKVSLSLFINLVIALQNIVFFQSYHSFYALIIS